MVDGITDAERLVKVETKLDVIEGVVLRMEAKLDAHHVPRAEINEMFKSRDERIERLETQANESKRGFREWLTLAVAGLALVASVWTKK